MNAETRTLVLVPGENIRTGQGHDYLMGKTRRMGATAKINAIAGGIVATEFERNADILTLAGDAAGLGITEAEQNREYILDRFPELSGNIYTETDSYDSPTIAQGAHSFHYQAMASGEGYKRVVLVDIDSHMRRLAGQMEAWGVPLDGTYSAEGVYVNDPTITESTRIRRQKIVDKIHKGEFMGRTTLISKQMLAERTKELILNIIGLVDPQGNWVSKRVTGKTRRNA